jgi:hypothetical protein
MIKNLHADNCAQNNPLDFGQSDKKVSMAQIFKKRMLEWSNPVEYVNNMYGCHPDDENNDYFKVVFAK